MQKIKSESELWAVVDNENKICWTRGGSSTSPKLMVYPTEDKAKRGLRAAYGKQMLTSDDIRIKLIYDTY